MENKVVDHSVSRIIYVEPNDVNGNINGVPLTPDYTDFCISFDLIVDVVSRMRANTATINQTKGKDGNNDSEESMKTYILSWTSKYNPEGKGENNEPNQVSFMGGTRYGNSDYLTTFYTDIHYNDFKNKTIVEGLGVESVNISFESYYTPSIKIRFIDVRGASIFGREEVLHTDEVLAEDNIWGCFFTFPYPKYKLQVKGFYGKAVTYQLCCTDFRANFNSRTGNYEIDMSFLGYDFGLLADIPIQYLIAAPYCKYADVSTYWETQKNTNPAWKMSDGRDVKTFYYIRRQIMQAIDMYGGDKSGASNITSEEIEEAIVDEEKSTLLIDMMGVCNEVYNSLGSKWVDERNSYKLDEGDKIFFNSKIGFRDSSGNVVGELYELFNEYKEKYPESDLSKTKYNFIVEWKNVLDRYNTTRPLISFTSVVGDEYASNNSNLNDFLGKLNEEINKVTSYQTTTRNVETSSSSLNEEKKQIQDLVGFLPNIGNVFRTLYCHLETFTHMIYRCAENIYAQKQSKERSLAKLGIPNYDCTDIDRTKADNDQIDPFPAVYTYEKPNEEDKNTGTEESEGVNDNVAVDAWIGDIRKRANANPWEEELLVEALFKAILHVRTEGSDSPSSFSSTKFPILPCDLNYNYIAGIGMPMKVDNLAGYLALRAAALFGVAGFSDSEAEEVGKAEALSYFESVADKTGIKEKILKSLGNGNKADTLYDVTLCEGILSNDSTLFDFERGNNFKRIVSNDKFIKKRNRQPFYFALGDNLQYCYAEDQNSNAFIPVRLNAWKSMNNSILEYVGNKNGSYFNFKNVNNSTTLLYKRRSEKFLDKINENDKDFFSNNEAFTVYYTPGGGGSYGDGTVITGKIEETYNKLKEGSVSVHGYTKDGDKNRFKKILNNHWKNISEDEYNDTYMKNIQSLYPSLKTLDITETGINESGDFPEYDNKKLTEIFSKVFNKNVSKKGDTFKYKGEDIPEENCYPLIPELRYNMNQTSYLSNVFTSRMYYLQNDIEGNRNGKVCSGFSTLPKANKAMKALIFLLSLDCVSDLKPRYIKNGNNASSCVEGVPLSIVLFHGALLWRKKFYDKNGFDPMIYNTSQVGIGENVFFEEVKQNQVPIIRLGSSDKRYQRGFIVQGNKTPSINYATYEEIFGSEGVDCTIANTLINTFEGFLDNEWETISSACELRKKSEEPISYAEFDNLCKKDTNLEAGLKGLCGNSYAGKYFLIAKAPDYVNLRSILSENNPANDTIKKIYLTKVIVQKSVRRFNDTEGAFSISKNTYKKYLNGFVKQIEEICDSETINKIESEEVADTNEADVEIKRLIYMFLKNMWDRWFSGNRRELFTTQHYMQNTIFIDSMYRNVYTHIHINCEILHDLLDESDGKSMVFKFLSDLTTKHHCMFFALPDYLNLGSPDGLTAEQGMETLFKPLPYSKINKVETMNRYIVMFTHKPSEINETTNSYKYDSFDIYSHDNDKNKIISTFNKEAVSDLNANEHDMQCTRYGYNVPAFGVEFGRQHNAIFKSINVGMQNPIQTEQAINALSLIAARGRDAGSRTIFYGQDLYNVYSGYSYTATIEMMGNAQIMPLMYFQLFNVPMFRGAYMIYGVTHTMKPGDMTTTVKAMKMSKHTLPWCQEWYAHYYFDSEGYIINKEYDDECIQYTGNNPWLKVAYGELGVKENPKGTNRGVNVEKYQRSTGNGPGAMWCGSFVNYCLKTAGVADLPKNASVAASYLNYGQTLDKPAEGAIAIIYGDGPKTPSHVGFVAGQDSNGHIVILGGNQSDSVKLSAYYDKQKQIKKYVYPNGYKPNFILQKTSDINNGDKKDTTT